MFSLLSHQNSEEGFLLDVVACVGFICTWSLAGKQEQHQRRDRPYEQVPYVEHSVRNSKCASHEGKQESKQGLYCMVLPKERKSIL